MPTPSVINKWRYSDAIGRAAWDQNNLFDNFAYNPVSAQVAGGAASGTAGHTNVMNTKKNSFEYFVLGTQTVLAPSLDSAGFGMNFTMTNTSNQGLEMTLGVLASSPASFLIGTSAAFFIRANFTVTTTGNVNPLLIGFRKAQAYNATLSTYTDFAAIGIVGTADPNELETQTQIGSAGVVSTDTTQTIADGTVFNLALFVDKSGNVTYQFNEQTPTVVAAYQFTAGLTVVPFFRMLLRGASAQVSCNYFEVGYQS